MADRTDTHTGIDLYSLGVTAAEPALLSVFSEVDAPLRLYSVTGRRRVGRDEDAEIFIADSKLSRIHAEVRPAPRGLWITDLKSHNGTFVDGEQVTDGPVPLGATVRLGRTLFQVVDAVRYRQRPVFDRVLLGGPALDPTRHLIAAVATSATPVLIEGETGTGKECVSLALHRASQRGALVTLNSAALPPELIESELFGHSRGAFSGSERVREGLFRTAHGGTLLLDEIGDLPLAAQAKLLRVLEGGEVRPVGLDKAITVDVRVIAATNHNLDEAVENGSFRSDLFHRLAACRVSLPPLRDRIEDIPELAAHFLSDGPVSFSVHAMERLLLWSWPGNVRELRNTVQLARATALAKGRDAIHPDELGTLIQRRPEPNEPASDSLPHGLLEALQRHNGNVSRAASELGLRRQHVYDLLRRHGVEPASFRSRR